MRLILLRLLETIHGLRKPAIPNADRLIRSGAIKTR